jgi:hypothetical protein
MRPTTVSNLKSPGMHTNTSVIAGIPVDRDFSTFKQRTDKITDITLEV